MWEIPTVRYRKAPYAVTITGAAVGNVRLNLNGKEIPSLQKLLEDHITELQPSSPDDMAHSLHTIVVRQWAEFFEAITSEQTRFRRRHELVGDVYSEALRSLERNLEVTHFVDGETSLGLMYPEWERLIARLERLMRIIQARAPPDSSIDVPLRARRPIPSYRHERRISETSQTRTDENQHSLDRVTYLGGVLLPITVVSGMLSMNDEYSPTGNMFFVFWAAAMPLCLITVLIIYADSIRKMEVWMEVAASDTDDDELEETSTSSAGSYDGLSAISTVPPVAYASAATAGIGVPQGECHGMPAGPGTVAEQRYLYLRKFRRGKDRRFEKKWKKRQLGWIGACKSIFRIYNLKELRGARPGRISASTRSSVSDPI